MSKVAPETAAVLSAESKNTLSADVILEGEIHTAGALIFDGRLKGSIRGAAELIIGHNARVEGEITAGAVTIYGHITGNVNASERIVAKAGAVVEGDLVSKRLSMEEGVVFVGTSKIAPK